MSRKRFSEYMATAPVWQLFIYYATGFGTLQGLIAHQGIVPSIVSGVLFGSAMTATVASRRRRDQSTSGGATQVDLQRALQGQLPVDIEEARSLAARVARRRQQLRSSLRSLPIVCGLVAVLGIVGGILTQNWVLVVLDALIIPLAVRAYFRIRGRLSQLHELAKQLPESSHEPPR